MLNKFKNDYIGKNIQFVFATQEGIVIESDPTFLPLAQGVSLGEFHPFFENMDSLMETAEGQLVFNCVHLDTNHGTFTTDIKMIKKDGGVFMVIYDLTQHYEEYQTVAQARNESIIKSELIVLKNKELEERERFKNQFIRNFSHELRNPLTGIVSITHLLEATNLTDEQQKMLDFLKESNNNLKLMLEDVLSISMIAAGKLELRNTLYNLHHLLKLLEFTYTAKAKPKGLFFSLVVDTNVPEYVTGDRLRLFQILTNLLDNALNHSVKGTVFLRAQVNQKRANKVSLRFEVADEGPGIPEQSLERIFESFSQLETPGNKEEKGLGLGLAIVKGLLELMGSEAKVKSELGKSTVFYFDLIMAYPVRPEKLREAKQLTQREVQAFQPKEDRKFRILLVEDDQTIQTLVFKLLMNNGHFYVDLVDDGTKVLEELVNRSYDLIIMDVHLPNITGDLVTKTIREFPFNNIKNTPIIGLTAYAFQDNVDHCLASGMNTVLTKPFDQDELLGTIATLLN